MTGIATPAATASRQHYQALDGLRGIAALAVVIFHFMEWIYTDFTQNFIAHGFLAVDFFFCLSGFVIGYAYDERLSAIGIAAFFRRRLIRLHPLVVIGSVLGLLGFLLAPSAGAATAYTGGRVLLLFLCSVFLVPFPVMEDRAFNLFGLNAPSWSLFWEYAANVVYALVLCRVKRSVLIAMTVLGAAALCWVSYSAGNLLGGWSRDNFWHGGARVAYSFTAGLLIFRSQWIIRNRLGFAGLVVLLSLAFLMPWTSFNWLTELLVVLLYFPLLVALGAGTTCGPRAVKACTFLGDLSYPLYMTHYWALWLFAAYLAAYKPEHGLLVWIVAGGTLFLVGFAYLVAKTVDIPLRNYLLQNEKKREQAKQPANVG